MIAIIIVAAIFVAGIAWMIYEFVTAPYMDEDGHVTSDPYHRIKKG